MHGEFILRLVIFQYPCGDYHVFDVFEVVIIDAVPRRTILSVLPRLFSGKHITHPAVRVERTARLEIHTDQPCVMHADGEYLGDTPLILETCPNALQIIRPPS